MSILSVTRLQVINYCFSKLNHVEFLFAAPYSYIVSCHARALEKCHTHGKRLLILIIDKANRKSSV